MKNISKLLILFGIIVMVALPGCIHKRHSPFPNAQAGNVKIL